MSRVGVCVIVQLVVGRIESRALCLVHFMDNNLFVVGSVRGTDRFGISGLTRVGRNVDNMKLDNVDVRKHAAFSGHKC